MKQETLTKYFTAGGIMLILAMFTNLVNTINQYDSYLKDNSNVVSAFRG